MQVKKAVEGQLEEMALSLTEKDKERAAASLVAKPRKDHRSEELLDEQRKRAKSKKSRKVAKASRKRNR